MRGRGTGEGELERTILEEGKRERKSTSNKVLMLTEIL
jgi:hypothetical protein